LIIPPSLILAGLPKFTFGIRDRWLIEKLGHKAVKYTYFGPEACKNKHTFSMQRIFP
jgi:hypothetical protein